MKHAKQPAEAIAIYQQFPDNPGAEERLGALLIESGQSADAMAHLEAAVAKSPTDSQSRGSSDSLRKEQPGR